MAIKPKQAMKPVSELETPAVTVLMDVMEDNIKRIQAHLAKHGIANRPHIKTHKIPALGKLQMQAGASGITCQKLGEVEVFTDAGVADDVLRQSPPWLTLQSDYRTVEKYLREA